MINKKWKDSESLISKDYKVEIRSSFPIKRVLDSVCVDFDILGRYFNDVKPDECLKDYYLRVLFEIDYDKSLIVKDKKNTKTDYARTSANNLLKNYFTDDFRLKKEIAVYIVGGATKSMMMDDSISYSGSMSNHYFNDMGRAYFRKLKIRNALDGVSIIKAMLSVVGDAHEKGV